MFSCNLAAACLAECQRSLVCYRCNIKVEWKPFFFCSFTFYCLQLYCPSGISPMEKLGCFLKASYDRVALPNQLCMLGVLVFPQSTELTWTTGSLTSAQMLIHEIAHRGVRTHIRVFTESWLWEKNPLPHQGIESASAAWWSGALTNWAT